MDISTLQLTLRWTSPSTSGHNNLILFGKMIMLYEPVHEISNNVVCAASKASDQPAHTRSLIRALASRLSFLLLLKRLGL